MTISKNFTFILALSMLVPDLYCQQNQVWLRYNVKKTDGSSYVFPFIPNSDITKYIEYNYTNKDTLFIVMKTFDNVEYFDTMRNGTTVRRGFRKKNYAYDKRHFHHIFSTLDNLDQIFYVRVMMGKDIFLFEKKRKNKYSMVHRAK